MLKKRSVNIKLITILVSLILPLFLTHVQQKTFAENVKKDTLVNKENLIKLNQKLVSEKNKEGLLQETIDFVLHLPVSGEMADSENGERSFEPTDVSFEVYEITDYVYQMAESGILDKTSVEDLINSQALELQELFRENLVETA
ncbi:MAG: hypothetical protein LBS33_05110, partial [Streptococcaceae bacterium]|nr:hypothetical protein [Streptococcaceae bacterium]